MHVVLLTKSFCQSVSQSTSKQSNSSPALQLTSNVLSLHRQAALPSSISSRQRRIRTAGSGPSLHDHMSDTLVQEGSHPLCLTSSLVSVALVSIYEAHVLFYEHTLAAAVARMQSDCPGSWDPNGQGRRQQGCDDCEQNLTDRALTKIPQYDIVWINWFLYSWTWSIEINVCKPETFGTNACCIRTLLELSY